MSEQKLSIIYLFIVYFRFITEETERLSSLLAPSCTEMSGVGRHHLSRWIKANIMYVNQVLAGVSGRTRVPQGYRVYPVVPDEAVQCTWTLIYLLLPHN